MNKRDLADLLDTVPDDAEIQVVVAIESGDVEIVPGDVLDITSAGFTRGFHVLYVKPAE